MSGPITVCHLITRLELGGAQQNTLYTVAHLAEPFRPVLLAGPGGILDDEARRSGIPIRFVPSLVRPIRPWKDARALLEITRVLREIRPRLVHTHSSKAGILGRLAARRAGVPLVVHTIHGWGFHERQPAALRRLLVVAERYAARGTDRFIAVSRAALDQGERLGIVPPGRGLVIRSGIDISAFAGAGAARAGGGGRDLRREIGLPESAPIAGMVACLKPQKAPIDFVEVAARVSRRIPQAHFVLVGDGDLREEVIERAAALGLSDRIHLLGWRRDVPRVMAALDVLVLTSRWEGLPRVVPEAIACGVPVVATLVDGTAEILRDGDNALACAAGDVDGLAERVTRLLAEPGPGRALAERARRLLPEFEIDAMVRAQESLYASLCGIDHAGGRQAGGRAPAGRPGGSPPADRRSLGGPAPAAEGCGR